MLLTLSIIILLITFLLLKRNGAAPLAVAPNKKSVLLLPILILAALVFSGPPAYAAAVSCVGDGNDAARIQAAVNSGLATLTGTCEVGTATIKINNPATITGTATINANQSQIFEINANNVTINGLTLNGGFVSFGWGQSFSNFTFTNNVIQNLWSGGPNGGTTALSGPGLIQSTISNNRFINLWGGGPPGYPNPTPLQNTAVCPGVDCWGSGGITFGGLDQTTISYNTFDQIAGDAMHLSWEAFTGNTNGRTTTGVVIAYNTFTRIRRIPMEIQSQPAGQCPGGCNYSAVNTTGLQIKGNYIHDFTPFTFFNTWGSSLVPDGAVSPQYINNTFIANPGSGFGYGYGGYAPCMESSGRNSISQGNVCASVAGGNSPFSAGVAQGNGSNPSFTSTYQNNVFCGSAGTTTISVEAATNPPTHSTLVDQYNYKNAKACPAGTNLTASNIAAAFVGSSVFGTNQTWNVSVISNLSIRYVEFFVDSSTTPIATQELSDLNTNFSSDQKWLYHVTLSTSSGAHTITAKVTDVSGASKSIVQTVGTTATTAVSAPVLQVAPTSLSFGSQTVGVASAPQTVSLSNSGTALLSLSSVKLDSANTAEFAPSSTCSQSIAPGTSCGVTVVFTPASSGTKSATITISDSAAGSPHTVSIAGTGVSAATSAAVATPSVVPTTSSVSLPPGAILWLANSADASVGGKVARWKDLSGNGRDAVQANPASQPTIVPANNQQTAVHFDGWSSSLSIPSLPIAGLTGMTVFIVSSNNQDPPNPGYGLYSLLNWPENAYWGTTFFGTYQTSSHFRFGTTQIGNENTYSMPASQTNSFVLGEWLHSGVQDTMWLNGRYVASYPGKLNALAGTGDLAQLGLGNNATYYSGDVSEIIVYGRSLNNRERRAIEKYLMSKYHL